MKYNDSKKFFALEAISAFPDFVTNTLIPITKSTTNYRYNLFHKNLSSYQVYITTLFSVSNSNITKNTKKTKCLNHFILSAPLLFHILNEGDTQLLSVLLDEYLYYILLEMEASFVLFTII